MFINCLMVNYEFVTFKVIVFLKQNKGIGNSNFSDFNKEKKSFGLQSAQETAV